MTSLRRTAPLALALTLTACGLFDTLTPPMAAEDVGPDTSPDAGVDAEDLDLRCGPDERVVSGNCSPCDPGTGRDAGDDPEGDDTLCTPITCGADEYVLDNACVACPLGTTNDEGDFAIGDDTECAPRLCGEDERVTQSVCEACAPGSTNEPGDDATQGDTECDVELCPADHRVEQNACVPCEQGATRPAGDDPTGDDTVCTDACLSVLGVTCAEFLSGYIKAPNTDADDQFGFSVAISDDFLAVGARFEDSTALNMSTGNDNNALDSGAVYVFKRSGAGWVFDALVKARTVDAGDGFGGAIALEGVTLVVGAKFDDSTGIYENGDPTSAGSPNSGAVHIFERNGPSGEWSQTAFLKAGSGRPGDLFGHAVALNSGVLVVGAPGDDSGSRGTGGDPRDTSVSNSGAAYVFSKPGAVWKPDAYLKASIPGQDDAFGHSVAVNKTLVVVGAPQEDSSVREADLGEDDAAPDSGAAYVFSRTLGLWTEAGYLKPDLIDAGDEFGHAVALSDNFVAVGARHESSVTAFPDMNPSNDGASRSGAVYIFTGGSPRWAQQALIKAPNPGASDVFGTSLATCGSYLYVGAQGEDGSGALVSSDPEDDDRSSAGAVYVYDGSNNPDWQIVTQVKASNPGSGDLFGFSVACSGTNLVVGARGESSSSTMVDSGDDDNAAPGAGAAYVFNVP